MSDEKDRDEEGSRDDRDEDRRGDDRRDDRRDDDDDRKDRTIKIAMSAQRPLRLDPKDWPIIAQAEREEGRAEHVSGTIRVRQHKDGRRVVYGWSENEAGYLIPPKNDAPDNDATAAAIVNVSNSLADPKLATDCLEDLPAQKLD